MTYEQRVEADHLLGLKRRLERHLPSVDTARLGRTERVAIGKMLNSQWLTDGDVRVLEAVAKKHCK